MVWHLTQHLFPFNFAVPGQTQNTLVRFADLLAGHPAGADLAARLQLPADLERKDPAARRNEFSGKQFKVLNFVVDLPVRIDELLPKLDPKADELGRIVFSLVEFQVVDAETARPERAGRRVPRALQEAPAEARAAAALARPRRPEAAHAQALTGSRPGSAPPGERPARLGSPGQVNAACVARRHPAAAAKDTESRPSVQRS